MLLPSIVGPKDCNGAATVTRGILRLLEAPPARARVTCLPALHYPPRHLRFKQLASVLRASCGGLPAKARFTYSSRLERRVSEGFDRGEFDLVLLNGSDLLWLLDAIPAQAPRALIAHNVEHLLYREQIDRETSLPSWGRTILRRDGDRLRSFELGGYAQCRNVMFLSSEDEAYARAACPGLNTVVLGPSFDYSPHKRVRRRPSETLNVGILGNFHWWPNREGLEWFFDRILPQCSSVALHLFGLGGLSVRPACPQVIAHGQVDELDGVWRDCDIMACPVLSGSGVCVKFAESLYNGMPVLATGRAARGFDCTGDPAIVLLNEPEQWIEFLNSRAAAELAKRSPSLDLTERFSVGVQRERFQSFIRSAYENADRSDVLPVLAH